MNTIILAWLLGAATTFWLFLEMGQFFKPHILAWGQNALFWFLWGGLWLAAALTALLAGALF